MNQRMLKRLNFQTTMMRWVEMALYFGTLDAKAMKLQSNEGIDSDARSPMAQLTSLLTSLSLKMPCVLCHKCEMKLCTLRVANTERRQNQSLRGAHIFCRTCRCIPVTCSGNFVGRGAALFLAWFAAFCSIEQT